MKQALATYPAIFQILAILLLQWHSIAPHLDRETQQPHCRGNHAECGCPQERIVSQTCCCYRQLPPCCTINEEEKKEQDVVLRDQNLSWHYLSELPCGDSPEYLAESLDNLKLLQPETYQMTPNEFSFSGSRSAHEKGSGIFADPPEPPPKLSIPA